MSVVFDVVWSVLLIGAARAFFSASVGLVSVLLLALPARAITLDGTNINQAIGYAGLTAATLLGLRVVAAIGRHRK